MCSRGSRRDRSSRVPRTGCRRRARRPGSGRARPPRAAPRDVPILRARSAASSTTSCGISPCSPRMSRRPRRCCRRSSMPSEPWTSRRRSMRTGSLRARLRPQDRRPRRRSRRRPRRRPSDARADGWTHSSRWRSPRSSASWPSVSGRAWPSSPRRTRPRSPPHRAPRPSSRPVTARWPCWSPRITRRPRSSRTPWRPTPSRSPSSSPARRSPMSWWRTCRPRRPGTSTSCGTRIPPGSIRSGRSTTPGLAAFVAPFGVDLANSEAAMITLEPDGGAVGEPGPQVVFGTL